MDVLEFSTPVRFTPNMSCVPSEYSDASFSQIDFSTNTRLKDWLINYLKGFSISNEHGWFDSLLFCPGNKAYRIMIALYREIGSRITVDNYRFFNWAMYTSELKVMGYRSDMKLYEDLEDVKFVFIFDLSFLHKESITYFCELLDVCYTNRIKMFVSTRDAAVIEKLPESYCALSKQKLWAVKVNDK